MKLHKLTLILFILISSLNIFSQEFSKVDIDKSENIALDSFNVRSVYKLDKINKIVFASYMRYSIDKEGLCLIHTQLINGKDSIRFISNTVGESYIYRPTFYINDSDTIIICEQGTEYTWGLDVFLLKQDTISFLGVMNVGVSVNKECHPESAVPILKINKLVNRIDFTFENNSKYGDFDIESIEMILNLGQDDEITVPTEKVRYRYDKNNGLIKL